MQDVGRETVRPSESQDGGRRNKDGNRVLETWRESKKRMIAWCQDQWRRKSPAYPKEDCAFSVNKPFTMPWFDDMPVCFNCRVPCPECRSELCKDLPMEKSTAHALLDFDEMHSDVDESKETSLSSSNVSENESSNFVRYCFRSIDLLDS